MEGAGQCPSCGQRFPAGSGYCPNDGTRIQPLASRDELTRRTLDGRYEIREALAPPQLPPNIPVALSAIVMRLLAKHPSERGTAGDLRTALREVEAIVGVAVPRAISNPNIALPRTFTPPAASAELGGYPVVSRAASKQLMGDVPEPPARRSWLVIGLIAAIASGLGITVILLAG